MSTTISQNVPTTTDGSELKIKVTELNQDKHVSFILEGVELAYVGTHSSWTWRAQKRGGKV